MRKIIFLASVLAGAFLFAPAAKSQNFTTVSATVVDPNGIPYSNGTVSAVLTGAGPWILNGQPYAGRLQNTPLDATGSFIAAMGSNAAITPGGTQWLFTVCTNPGGIPLPLGTGNQCFNVGISISGSTQSVTSALNAAAPKLTNFTGSGPGSVSLSAALPILASPDPITGTGSYSCPTCLFGTLANTQIAIGNTTANSVQGTNNFTFTPGTGQFFSGLNCADTPLGQVVFCGDGLGSLINNDTTVEENVASSAAWNTCMSNSGSTGQSGTSRPFQACMSVNATSTSGGGFELDYEDSAFSNTHEAGGLFFEQVNHVAILESVPTIGEPLSLNLNAAGYNEAILQASELVLSPPGQILGNGISAQIAATNTGTAACTIGLPNATPSTTLQVLGVLSIAGGSTPHPNGLCQTSWQTVIGGSIAANQVAFGSGTNAITGSNNLTYTGTRFTVSPTPVGGSSNDLATILNLIASGLTGSSQLLAAAETQLSLTQSSGAFTGHLIGQQNIATASFTGSATAAQVSGTESDVRGSGTTGAKLTNIAGFYADQGVGNIPVNAAVNSFAFQSDPVQGGTTINAAYYASDQTNGATHWAFYSVGGQNFFGGTEGSTFGGPVIFNGSSSGSFNISVNSTAGNLLLGSNATLSSAGALTVVSCTGCGGGAGSITFPQTVAGTVTSGGVVYANSTTQISVSGLLPTGDFVLGGGAGGAPTATFSVVPVANGGTGTGSTLTGLLRGSASAMTAAELSGDVATSGSNSVTVKGINGTLLSTLATGILKVTNITGAVTTAIAADFPTLNQNTTGTAANLSGTPALPNGTTATTQTVGDNTTKLATDAFVIANAGSISGLTTNCMTKAASSTTVACSLADDGLTTASTFTYTGAGGITASAGPLKSASDGVHPGNLSLLGNTTVVAPASNSFNLMGPSTATFTSYALQFPNAGPTGAGYLAVSGLTSSVAQVTYVPGTPTLTLCSGSQALGTSLITSGAAASTVTITCTGLASTDDIMLDFNGSPIGTTGFIASANGILTVIKWPSTNTINISVQNNTASSITPGAITLNYRVVR